MQNKVLAYCRRQRLIEAGDSVTCAVSGGVDSVVMLDILSCLSGRLGFSLRAAHFNHQLRGGESDRDEQFVRALCSARQIPLTVGRGDVAARAAETGESIEEAARILRYAFFETLDGKVATAHNADDNAETVLVNLVRGTSLAGLCGIAPVRDRLIRPLLCLDRSEIEAYAAQHDLSFVEDSTNADDFCLRNRLRHHLMPLLRRENPSLSARLLVSCDLLRQDEACLQQQAQALLERAQRESGYSCAVLQSAPEALRTRALRLMLREIHAPKLSASHILAAQRLVFSDSPSAACDLPGGFRLRREYDALRLEPRRQAASFRPVAIDPDGETYVSELGLRVRCRAVENLKDFPKSAFTFAVKCDTIEAANMLVLRPRQAGDALRLSGGTRTVKRLLIDHKIPAPGRALVPVLADIRGVLAVYPFGVNLDRLATGGDCAIIITIEKEEM